MTLVKTQFSPQNHGYQFVNRFEFPLSVMFQLPFVSPINLDDIVYGLCGGMCFGALDYFYTGVPIPGDTEVDELETSYLRFLWDRQLDSLKLPTVLKVIEWMILDEGTLGRRLSRWEVPKLRRRIDKGDPAVLGLIRTHGFQDPTKNHQVMATGYDFDPLTKDLTVHLYDPNHPNKEPTLTMNLATPSSGVAIHQSTGENLYAFFVIPYRKGSPPKST